MLVVPRAHSRRRETHQRHPHGRSLVALTRTTTTPLLGLHLLGVPLNPRKERSKCQVRASVACPCSVCLLFC